MTTKKEITQVNKAVSEPKATVETAKDKTTAKTTDKATVPAAKDKTTAKTEKKQPTAAETFDKVILAGGTYDDICKKMNAYNKKIGGKVKYTQGTINAHIKYRLSKNPKYLGKLKVKETGIF